MKPKKKRSTACRRTNTRKSVTIGTMRCITKKVALMVFGTINCKFVPTFARIAKESFLSESQQKKKTNLCVYNGAAAVGRYLSGDLDRVCLCELICGASALNRQVFGKIFAALSYIYTLSKDIIFFSFCWYTSGYYTMSLKYLDYPVLQKKIANKLDNSRFLN